MITIIGGGICGLSCAYEFLKNGEKVTIYEKNEIGQSCSIKAAGMLASRSEVEFMEEDLWHLNKECDFLWDDYQQELENISNIKINRRKNGIIITGSNQDDLEQIKSTYSYQQSIGVDNVFLNKKQLIQIEPLLSPYITDGVYSENDSNLDTRSLLEALKFAVKKLGGIIKENSDVSLINIKNNKIKSLVVNNETIPTKNLICCTGVDIPKFNTKIKTPPVRPLKGQMLRLRPRDNMQQLKTVIWCPKIYAAPLDDGSIMVGATVEEMGLDDKPTAGGIMTILDHIWRVLPCIDEMIVEEIIVGHRPTSLDDAPIYGPCDVDGLYWCIGHHRNGILLAPISGKILYDIIINNKATGLYKKFYLNRF